MSYEIRDSNPQKILNAESMYNTIKKYQTSCLENIEVNLHNNQGAFFKADNVKNLMLRKQGLSSEGKNLHIKQKMSYSTILSNPIIAPNTQKRKTVLSERPSNSSNKMQRPDKYLD